MSQGAVQLFLNFAGGVSVRRKACGHVTDGLGPLGRETTAMDAKHMAELRTVLNKIDDDGAKKAIQESVRVNFHHFTRIIEAI